MKVLHVMGTFFVGGAEMFIRNLILLHKEKGIDVELLLLSNSNNFIAKELRDSGVLIHALHPEGKGIYNPINIFKLISFLKKYDVIHVHLFPEQYWAGFANIITGRKTVMICTEHNTENDRRKIRIVKPIERFIYRYGYDAVVACSEDALKTQNDYSPKSNNISIPNGVDTNKFHVAKAYTKQERFKLQEDDFIVTMVASFKSQKMQELLIEALTLLPNNVHAVFCGEGVLLEEKKAFAQKIGVAERTHFLGNCKDVDRITKTSDVIALFSHYEGLSLSCIEGMAAEKPFVASNVNGLASIVEGAGILVENNPQIVAKVLFQLMNDKEYQSQIAKQCWQRAQQYDVHIMANKYYQLYENVIKKHQSI